MTPIKLDFNIPKLYKPSLYQDFMRKVSSCKCCQRKNDSIATKGSIESPFVFVGKGFSKAELSQNELWSPNTNVGRILSRYLSHLGLRQDCCYFTSAFLHPLCENSSCFVFKKVELSLMRPRLIFLLGEDAKVAVLGYRAEFCNTYSLYSIDSQLGSIILCPVPHPVTVIESNATYQKTLSFLTQVSRKFIETDKDLKS